MQFYNERAPNKFKEIFDKALIGIISYNKSGKLTDANPAALQIAGIPSLDSIKGTNPFKFIVNFKEEKLLKNGSIRSQFPLDLSRIKESQFYSQNESMILDVDLAISTINSGFLM